MCKDFVVTELEATQFFGIREKLALLIRNMSKITIFTQRERKKGKDNNVHKVTP